MSVPLCFKLCSFEISEIQRTKELTDGINDIAYIQHIALYISWSGRNYCAIFTEIFNLQVVWNDVACFTHKILPSLISWQRLCETYEKKKAFCRIQISWRGQWWFFLGHLRNLFQFDETYSTARAFLTFRGAPSVNKGWGLRNAFSST